MPPFVENNVYNMTLAKQKYSDNVLGNSKNI